MMRKESRCSHYRLDYPNIDTENWEAWINIYKGSDGNMQLEKQPFGSWPASGPLAAHRRRCLRMHVDKIDAEKCVGCGNCVNICPRDVFRLDESGGQSLVVFPEDCQICNLCRMYCPEGAISLSPGKCAAHMLSWGYSEMAEM